MEALVDEGVAQVLDGRAKGGDRCGRGDDEELVGAEPAGGGAGWTVQLDEPGEPQERVIATGVTVRVVEEPEIVEIDQGDADRAEVGARPVDGGGELGGHGTVVQQPGQRVATGGLEELDGLARDAHLRAAEDEVQEQPGDRGGDEGHREHLLLDVTQRADDRGRVAPDGGDRVSRSVRVDQRQIRLEDRVIGGGAGRDARGHASVEDAGVRRAAGRGGERVSRLHHGAARARPRRQEDLARWAADVDALKARARREGREVRLEVGGSPGSLGPRSGRA